MRNAKREPMTSEQRHALLDAIDAHGGVERFAAQAEIGVESIARALTGAGVLPATRIVLKVLSETYVLRLASAARAAR